MTDKQLERANEIKAELLRLNQLKKGLQNNIHLTINFEFYKDLREPFVDVVEGKIAELKAEYEKL